MDDHRTEGDALTTAKAARRGRESPEPESEQAFLLTRQWRDTSSGVELVFWASGPRGPLRIVVESQDAICFIERGHLGAKDEDVGARVRSLDLSTLSGGVPVDGLYFRKQRELAAARRKLRARGLRLFESDIKPSDRYLMERFVTAGLRAERAQREVSHHGFRELFNPKLSASDYRPELTVLSLDIETGGYDDQLYSIACTTGEAARVFLLRNEGWESASRTQHPNDIEANVELTVHHDEETLLSAFFSFIAEADPDVLIGWNVVDFDLRFLEECARRCQLPFAMGRGRDHATVLSPSGPGGKRVARIPGRAVLDGIDTMRNATYTFEDFSLEAVASKLLGRGKLIAPEASRISEVRRLFSEEPWTLVRYNVEDCRLVQEIFERTHLIEFAIERARLTGLLLDRVGGSVAAFDNLYLPRLHRKGRVANDVEQRPIEAADLSPGGYVFESEPGLFDNVLVLDFKSLYPSIIRTFLVDPLGMVEADEGSASVPGFKGASFSRDPNRRILPSLIEELWGARDDAKRLRRDALSRAIKIIMNSFYGVLGTTACRFFDPRLASSITLRGHEIMTESRRVTEELGYRVIYGDTDSLFALVGPGRSDEECRAIGAHLADSLTRYWRDRIEECHHLESYLEVEFEIHFEKFFMPTVRGSDHGSKKRYAGLVRSDGATTIEFTGLEAVRSDWTPLARRFQRELYRRIFLDEPFEDYVKSTVAELYEGKLDNELVYRKRLRRRLEDYKKNVPPHVQAARKSSSAGKGRWVEYVITASGPTPLDAKPEPLDYDHYLHRQLAPAADSILALRETSVSRIVDAQLSLF
jgi:DNA polymerase-2